MKKVTLLLTGLLFVSCFMNTRGTQVFTPDDWSGDCGRACKWIEETYTGTSKPCAHSNYLRCDCK